MEHKYTPNLELILYEANDIPSYLQDWNTAMLKLDDYCATLNSRLYDYVTTLSNIYNKLEEHDAILEEALKNATEARDLAISVSNTIQGIMDNYENLRETVNNHYSELTKKVEETNNQLNIFESNFTPITQAEYDAMGSGRPKRIFVIIG